MRPDLNKLLCEHERYNHRSKFRDQRHSKKYKYKNDDGEDIPTHEGMTERYHYDSKDFGENLSPLYRQIEKYVGRSFDDFYSDLCTNFDRRSAVGNHIFQHLSDRFVWKTWIKDGEVWFHNEAYGPLPITGNFLSGRIRYYVDPRDRIIKRVPNIQKKDTREEKPIDTIYLDDDHVLRLIRGVWYIFELRELPEPRWLFMPRRGVTQYEIINPYNRSKRIATWEEMTEKEQQRYGIKRLVADSKMDLFTGNWVSKSIYPSVFYHRITHYHATKKQASHKELKKAGLVQ
jgi:hypothetical protein